MLMMTILTSLTRKNELLEALFIDLFLLLFKGVLPDQT